MNYGDLEVVEELEPKEFVKQRGGRLENHHIHLFPNREDRELHAFLHIGEPGSHEVVKTVIENVSFKFRFSGERRDVRNWFLSGGEADNFLLFLNSLKWERTDAQISVRWSEEAGRPMMKGSGIGEESLRFSYKTKSENYQQLVINSVYDESAKGVQMMVNF